MVDLYIYNRAGWQWLARVAGGLLLALSIVKLGGVLIDWNLFSAQKEPVFHLSLSVATLGSGIIECVLGIFILIWAQRILMVGVLMIALCQVWLTYQAIRAVVPEAGRCPCLGPAPLWFPWLGRIETPLLLSIALWFGLVGWALVWIGFSGSVETWEKKEMLGETNYGRS